MNPNEILHRVITSSPIDRTAAIVTGGGVSYDCPKIVTTRHSDIPLPLRTVPKECTEDLTGVRFGRFVVQGLCRDAKGFWVVRCSCGRYETRRARAIRNQRNHWDCCQICRHTLFLKREAHFRTTGRDMTWEELL